MLALQRAPSVPHRRVRHLLSSGCEGGRGAPTLRCCAAQVLLAVLGRPACGTRGLRGLVWGRRDKQGVSRDDALRGPAAGVAWLVFVAYIQYPLRAPSLPACLPFFLPLSLSPSLPVFLSLSSSSPLSDTLSLAVGRADHACLQSEELITRACIRDQARARACVCRA